MVSQARSLKQVARFGSVSSRPLRVHLAGFLPGGVPREGYPHGMPTTHADVINADVLAFIKG